LEIAGDFSEEGRSRRRPGFANDLQQSTCIQQVGDGASGLFSDSRCPQDAESTDVLEPEIAPEKLGPTRSSSPWDAICLGTVHVTLVSRKNLCYKDGFDTTCSLTILAHLPGPLPGSLNI
jgi:hypothetical protein